MRRLLTALTAVGLLTWTTSPGLAEDHVVRTVKGGILDEAKLYVDALPASKTVVIRLFSATDADLVNGDKKEETKKMQVDAPPMFADQFVTKLKSAGPFTEVSVLDVSAAPPAGALVVEGKFTEMDPGSRAKRYVVGFGAGKSGVTVEGSIKSADGAMLATFQQRRIGVMGVAGGDSMAKLVSDTKTIAEDLAKFLSEWAKGNKLK
jgi:Domain of unknown function (DUF4410)